MNMKWNMLLLLGLFFWTKAVLGDGSKELYPEGVKGNRAFLVSLPLGRNAFANQARHFTFAREGETIAVASSAQNIGMGRIRLTAPNGKIYETANNNIGRISTLDGSTRKAELAGPRVGYVPFEVGVETGQTGIWQIEFTSPDTDPINAALTEPHNVRADSDWIQNNEGSLIAAWDISVRSMDDTAWLAGRVFVSVLQLHISKETLKDIDGAFYGRNYVLTNDGYVYHVDGNGSHGIDFAYFVNSSGILNGSGAPSYKSANQDQTVNFHNPNDEDGNLHITHKMFYNLPDREMPKESNGWFPGGKSWLYSSQKIAEVKNLGIVWEEESDKRIDKNGVFIRFETNYSGRYKVVINPKSDKYSFKEREINVETTEGLNRFFWDGLDGEGKFIPYGKDYLIGISISLVKGEIHFPYFDMEINPNGILVERVDMDTHIHSDAIMFWDDSDITGGQVSELPKSKVNKIGSASRIDGHRWGTYSATQYISGASNGGYGAYSYGNEKVMDTWTFTAQLQAEVQERVSVGRDEVGEEENSVPVVKEGYFTLYQGGGVVFDLLEKNPREAFSGNPARVEIVVPPRYGDIVLDGTTVSYTTNDILYFGADEFSYRLTGDGAKEPVESKVNLQILKTNPVANDDFFEVVYNTAHMLEIAENDFVEYSHLNKQSIRIIDQPMNGILFKAADEEWHYQSYERYTGKDRFSYQVMDGNGNWSNTAVVELSVKGLFIPNTITPNGDQKNDTFEIIGLSNFDQVELSIMDRSGRLVYASRDYKNDWTVPGNVTSGVYFYVFKGSRHGQRPVIDKGALMVLTSGINTVN